MGALSHIKVLDFSRVLAGPSATMLLADYGAEVIKIEQPGRGDDTRQWGPPYAGQTGQFSAYYLSVNRNKRSVTINLKSPEGQEIARQLAMQCDVLIENFKVGQMAGYGLDYEALRQENPGLVYCSLTGYGQDGPYSQRPGYDYVIQAQSGLMSITGPADGVPHKVGVAITDVLTGLYAANAIQTALLHRERSGQGQYIDVALLDCQLAALVNVASNALISGQQPARFGNAHPNIVPYEAFEASDGLFVIAAGNDRQFQALCEIIEQPDLASDKRFSTNPARVVNREQLITELQTIFRQRPAAEWIEALVAVKIPCGEINDVQSALRLPHVEARGLLQTVTLSDGTSVEIVGNPVKLSVTPAETDYAPPATGADTEAILQEWLDYDAATLATYRERGII